jgi:hypothetical protein
MSSDYPTAHHLGVVGATVVGDGTVGVDVGLRVGVVVGALLGSRDGALVGVLVGGALGRLVTAAVPTIISSARISRAGRADPIGGAPDAPE